MANRDGREYLILVWKDPKSRRKYSVGELSRNGQFEFSYGYEVEQAIEEGFELLIAFPKRKKYISTNLFSVFASRLPDPKRKGIENILEKYGLNTYDAYELLRKSGARLPIDNLEFIDPIFDFSENVEREFFVSGTRHYIGCGGAQCTNSTNVIVQENLVLLPEPDNTHDKYAIRITKESGEMLGYLPRYYAEGISSAINNKFSIDCVVMEVNKVEDCDECIKIKLAISSTK